MHCHSPILPCLTMRFRPTVPPRRMSRLPRSNCACRRAQPFWLWRSARSWPRDTCSRRERHRTPQRWHRMPARRRSPSSLRNSARTRHGPISTRAVCAVSTTRAAGRRSSSDCATGHDRSGNACTRRRECECRRGAACEFRGRSHQRAHRRPRRHRAPRTRGRKTHGHKSSNRYFQRRNRPQRAIMMFSAATPPPQLMRLPTSAPATIHSIVGRGIGTTIPAFSDFASS